MGRFRLVGYIISLIFMGGGMLIVNSGLNDGFWKDWVDVGAICTLVGAVVFIFIQIFSKVILKGLGSKTILTILTILMGLMGLINLSPSLTPR